MTTTTDVVDLTAQRDALKAGLQKVLDDAKALGVEPDADDQNKLAAGLAAVEKLTAQITELEAKPVASPGIPGHLMSNDKKSKKQDVALKAGDWVTDRNERANLRKGESLNDFPALKASLAGEADSAEAQFGSVAKLVAALNTSGGSAVVPQSWSNVIIDLAIANSAIGQAGCTTVPMLTKTVEIGRITADPTAAFRTEGSAISASDPSFDNVTLTAKSLNALVIASVEWLQDAQGATDLVQRTIAQAIGKQLDLVALYGGITSGHGGISLGSPNPTGILAALAAYNSGSNVLGGATNGTTQTATAFWGEILDTVFTVLDGNHVPSAFVWNTKLARAYAKATDSQGRYLEAPEQLPVGYMSNDIPSYTQGTMTNVATDVFAGDFSQLLVGVRGALSIHMLTERYADNGQVGFVATWRGDIQVADPKAFAAYTAIKGS